MSANPVINNELQNLRSAILFRTNSKTKSMSSFCERRKRELFLFMIIVPIIRNIDDLQDIGLHF